HVMDQTAITYPYSTLTDMSGAMIKDILEDVGDNLFNADPYKQQGGDMVRVGGMRYACDPNAAIGSRIRDMRLIDQHGGQPIEANKTYKVAGWAPVAEGASGEPIWEVVAKWLRDKKTVAPRRLNAPKLIGMAGNPGLAQDT
ncbi:MAG: thiosulfohydrolase SoxB, partial [Rhodocyclaceae bacterium UTPRO2]